MARPSPSIADAEEGAANIPEGREWKLAVPRGSGLSESAVLASAVACDEIVETAAKH